MATGHMPCSPRAKPATAVMTSSGMTMMTSVKRISALSTHLP